MNQSEVKQAFEKELNNLNKFNNFHGITRENVDKFIVEPYAVLVDPDDLATPERDMWVVLSVSKECLVAFDPLELNWSVLHPLQKDKYIQVIGEETLAEALDGM